MAEPTMLEAYATKLLEQTEIMFEHIIITVEFAQIEHWLKEISVNSSFGIKEESLP